MKKTTIILIFYIIINRAFSLENNIQTYNKSSLKYSVSLDTDKESVVCLHAFLRSYTSMKPIGRFVSHQGYEAFLWNYETRKFTLEEHAEHLVRLLQKIAKAKPGKAIHFITHSIGGVITKVALCHPDCPQEAKIGKAILLAPPNQGSHLARKYRCLSAVQFIFGGKLGRQLLTYCPKKMLSTGEMPESVNTLIISGHKSSRFIPFKMDCPNDGKVEVVETELPNVSKNISLDVCHTYIIVNPTCFKLIKRFLAYDNKTHTVAEESISKDEIQTENANKSKSASKPFIIHCFASQPSKIIGFP